MNVRIDRIEDQAVLGTILRHLMQMDTYVRTETDIEPRLAQLVTMRASQINGCAYCMSDHLQRGLSAGDSIDRYTALSAWHEVPEWFTPRERAALLWAETLTKISTEDVTDDLYASVRAHFSEKDLADLTLLIVAVNTANRVAIPFRAVPDRFGVPEPEAAVAD